MAKKKGLLSEITSDFTSGGSPLDAVAKLLKTKLPGLPVDTNIGELLSAILPGAGIGAAATVGEGKGLEGMLKGKQGGGAAADPAAVAPQAAAAPTQAGGPQSLFAYDPLSMQTLWAQAFAPYLQQQNQMWGPMLQQYGAAMNSALANPMPAQARQVLQAAIPQQQARQAQYGADLAASIPAQASFPMLLQQLQSNQQAAQKAYEEQVLAKAAAGGAALPTVTPGQKVSPAQAQSVNSIVAQLTQ